MFVGSWLLNDLKPVKYVRDATPIVPPEPIAEFEVANNDLIRQVLGELRPLVSLASVTAWLKKLGFRVFIHGSAIPEPSKDFVKAALAGGVDGVVPEGFLNVEDNIINIVSTGSGGSQVSYAVIDAINPNVGVSKPYGAIIINAPPSKDWLIRARDWIKESLGVKEVFTSLDLASFNIEFVKEVVGIIDGFMILEIPSIVSLAIDNQRSLNVFRCPNCYVDFETESELRKCPKCGGRVRPIIKAWSKALSLDSGVLRLKGLDELSIMRLEPPKVINL